VKRGAVLAFALLFLMPQLSLAQTQPSEGKESPEAALEAAKEKAKKEEIEKQRRAMIEGSTEVDLAGPVDPEEYRVGPGDALELSLWGGISRTVPIEVTPEGTVLLPGSGSFSVRGMTLREVQQEIKRRLRSEFRGVQMEVRLVRPRTFRVYLTGQVMAPGPVRANGVSRVGDLVGPEALLKDASKRRIEVRHLDGTIDIADLQLFLHSADPKLNPWLVDGDVIYVPKATEFVTIRGAVASPDMYELGVEDSLTTLLRLGGGVLPEADSSRALLVRWSSAVSAESSWVSVERILSGDINPVLRDGDRLYIYFIPRFHLQKEAVISGEVARPGTYPIEEGRDRITDLVRAAGGFLPEANLSSIRVKRKSPLDSEDPELKRLLSLSRQELTNSEYEVLRTKLAGLRNEYRLDWNRLLTEGPPLDILLFHGDEVEVDRLVSTIRVDGEVRRPGILAYRAGLGVDAYIRNAGGFSDRAWTSKVRVTRSVTGQTLLARDVQHLNPGDFVWVPEKPDVTIWDHTTTLLTALAQVATVVIAIRSIR